MNSTEVYKVEKLDEDRSGYSFAVDNGRVMYAALFDWEDDAQEYCDWMNERIQKANEADWATEFDTTQTWVKEDAPNL